MTADALYALALVVALLAVILGVASFIGWVQCRVIDERRRGWVEGFETAREVARKADRYWGPRPWASPSGPSAPGKGPGLLQDVS